LRPAGWRGLDRPDVAAPAPERVNVDPTGADGTTHLPPAAQLPGDLMDAGTPDHERPTIDGPPILPAPNAGPAPDATVAPARPPHTVRRRRGTSISLAMTTVFGAVMLAAAPQPVAAEPPAAAIAAESSLDPALVAELEAALDEGFAASGMPGVTVGLWIPGQGEWVATRGVSDRETSEPMDRANQSKIGSITKTLVGTTALQIIGAGDTGLTLDDTIDRWYPDFPEASRITVRMLLNMSSGIASPGMAQIDRICADPYSTITPDEYIAIGAATPREPYAPGDGFTYSGVNTFLVARILEKVTGTDLTTLLDEHLIGPLGMTRSRFAPDGQVTAPLNHGYSQFCPPNDPVLTDTTDWFGHESWAAGAMVSTIDDLHTWGVALGEGFGLTSDLRVARVTEVGPGSGYGLGVNTITDPATGCTIGLTHAGAEPGYGADVIYLQTTGSVYALLGNGDGGNGEAAFAVTKALGPILLSLPVAGEPPTGSCRDAPPAPAPTPTVAVATRPTFTG
jgi:D-alanyl-D-alanine carboxypeptidase